MKPIIVHVSNAVVGSFTWVLPEEIQAKLERLDQLAARVGEQGRSAQANDLLIDDFKEKSDKFLGCLATLFHFDLSALDDKSMKENSEFIEALLEKLLDRVKKKLPAHERRMNRIKRRTRISSKKRK